MLEGFRSTGRRRPLAYVRHRCSSSHRKLKNPKPLPPVLQRANHTPLTLHPAAQVIVLPFVQDESGRKAARGGVQLRWAYATAKSSRKALRRHEASRRNTVVTGRKCLTFPNRAGEPRCWARDRPEATPSLEPGAAPSPQHPQSLDRWATSMMHGDACPPHGEMQGGSWYQVRASWQTERGARREEAGMWTPRGDGSASEPEVKGASRPPVGNGAAGLHVRGKRSGASHRYLSRIHATQRASKRKEGKESINTFPCYTLAFSPLG